MRTNTRYLLTGALFTLALFIASVVMFNNITIMDYIILGISIVCAVLFVINFIRDRQNPLQ